MLAALGRKPFSRPSYSYGQSRADVLTHFIRVTHPTEGDTPEAFAARMKEADITSERLFAAGFPGSTMAPAYRTHAWLGRDCARACGGSSRTCPAAARGWEMVTRKIPILTTRMRTTCNPLVRPIRGNACSRNARALTQQERAEGAVDPGWFHRVYLPLGKEALAALAEAAKYGCTGQGHKKAIVLAEVLLGRAKKQELIAGIRQRQLARLGAFARSSAAARGERRDKDLLLRYKVIQEYRRYARGLSPMSRESAVRAGDIGLENLARTAGYADPIRLEWAMEARAIADLAAGPIAVTHQGVTVTLALDEQSQPQLTIQRGDKPLKNIPSSIRKHPKVAVLADRKTDLKRQASRVRLSLENAMCRGDAFTGAELRQFFDHPILVPSLERLVLLGEGIIGYPTAKGKGLVDHRGKIEPIKPDEQLRIAHPHDLLAGGEWH